MTTWTLTAPWPKPPLSMNDRHHWRAKARITKQIHADVTLLVKAARIPALKRAVVTLRWTVPDRKVRDEENPTATLKPICDAITRAGVVPDDCPEWMGKRMPEINYVKGVSKVEIIIEGEVA